jgi:hypothetical protein
MRAAAMAEEFARIDRTVGEVARDSGLFLALRAMAVGRGRRAETRCE